MKLFILSLFLSMQLMAQNDSTAFFKRIPQDTSKLKLNSEATYNRPFLSPGKSPVAIGGYVEANSNTFVTDGISKGTSFTFERLSLFVASSINKRIKFLSELEFEEGGKEIGIEYAALDIEFHPLLNLRGGIIINPIGSFNQNHDGPKWEIIDRPISSTTIIPATLNSTGFGFFGKIAKNNMVWAYEAYMTNGLDDKIINNDHNKTWFAAGKENPERFNESFNGQPSFTAKTSIRHRKAGEIGISWFGGVYNQFSENGVIVDKKRRCDLIALDFNTTLPKIKTVLNGEWAWSFIDLPDSYPQQYGSRQRGGYLDIVQPIIKRKIFGWENSTVNIALRTEYADYNIGTFNATGGNIFDEVFAIVPGLSFRPSSLTVFRVNYRYRLDKDIFGTHTILTTGFQFGFATYF
jgi:hypothetical protein